MFLQVRDLFFPFIQWLDDINMHHVVLNLVKCNFYFSAVWWSTYGEACPKLQKFAVRILSQTCNGASRYGLNKSMAEKLLTEGRNSLEQQKISDLAYVHYNMQLRNFVSGGNKNTVPDDIDPMDDWIVEKAQGVMSPNDEPTWMDLDGRASSSRGSGSDGAGSSSGRAC